MLSAAGRTMRNAMPLRCRWLDHSMRTVDKIWAEDGKWGKGFWKRNAVALTGNRAMGTKQFCSNRVVKRGTRSG